MQSLLAGAALGMAALAVGCSDVRVDDDGSGGAGGAPSSTPASARLFAAGWYASDSEGAPDVQGVQIWNDPDAGIARVADVRLPIDGARDLAIVGERLCVLAGDELLIYDGVWKLEAGAQPSVVIHKNQSGQKQPPMRALDGLDMLWADNRLYGDISSIDGSATGAPVGWHDPVYDEAADRLFVASSQTIQVIESASESASFEPDWTLYEDDERTMHRLTTDGVTLFGGRGGSGGFEWKIGTWPLSVAEPTSPNALNAGPPADIHDLFPIPGGGVVAAAEHSIWAWALDPGDPQAPTAYLLTPDDWSSGVVSAANRIYSSGNVLTVFEGPSLGDASELAPASAGALALIERDLSAP